MSDAPVRVLVVDDSAFARKVVREVLEHTAGIDVVGIARDGLDALEKIAELRPDVVTLDLVMPSCDGIAVLRSLQTATWRPAVVVVSMADEDSELGVEALALGAFEVVKKPTALANERLYELDQQLASVVVAAAKRPAGHPIRLRTLPPEVRRVVATRTKMLLIGASTGGPSALSLLLHALPAAFPVPIAIVLHMPPGYTEAFAKRLDVESALDVMEAYDGLRLRPGLATVARAGLHLRVEPDPEGWVCRLDASPSDSMHRPAVDVLFESGAAHVGSGVLGVVLTGMGSDGRKGAQSIVEAGGRILTESEASCVVYGMPRVVAEAGLSTASAPIEAMAGLICDHL